MFYRLPEEIVFEILRKADAITFSGLPLTCKLFNNIMHNPYFQKTSKTYQLLDEIGNKKTINDKMYVAAKMAI